MIGNDYGCIIRDQSPIRSRTNMALVKVLFRNSSDDNSFPSLSLQILSFNLRLHLHHVQRKRMLRGMSIL